MRSVEAPCPETARADRPIRGQGQLDFTLHLGLPADSVELIQGLVHVGIPRGVPMGGATQMEHGPLLIRVHDGSSSELELFM